MLGKSGFCHWHRTFSSASNQYRYWKTDHPRSSWHSWISGLTTIVALLNIDSDRPPKSPTLTPLKATTGELGASNVSACLPHNVSLTLWPDRSTSWISRLANCRSACFSMCERIEKAYWLLCRFGSYRSQLHDFLYNPDDIFPSALLVCGLIGSTYQSSHPFATPRARQCPWNCTWLEAHSHHRTKC